MQDTPAETSSLQPDRTLRYVALAIAALVAVRIIIVILTPAELGPDEAQYWRWSEKLDWGYYSKPPLIAWVIALSTSVFGDGEWAVRLLAPVVHGLAAFALFCLARRMFDARTGAWASAIYLLMPGVWLSSVIMATDAVLLPLWAAGLYCLWRMREGGGLKWAAAFGLSLGLAMLAKYAALYLAAGAVLAALLDRETRRALLSPAGLVAVVVAAAVLAPNLLWNAAHDFATVSHTSDNANWSNASIDPENFLKFLTDQMAVFGPVSFLVMLAGVAVLVRRGDAERATRETWLLCFIVPVLLVIAVQAVISRAHANWAATAYPAASILVASWTARLVWRRVIAGGIALNVLVGLISAALWVSPQLADGIGAAGAFKRVRGWDSTADTLADIARTEGATAIMFDEREVWHGIDYYGRTRDMPPVRSWRRLDEPRSHAEQSGALQPGEDQRVLIASVRADFRPRIRADFAEMQDLGSAVIGLGGGNVRRIRLYIASGYAPLPRTPEYEARFAGQRED